jgi:hypothetical protein
MIAAGVDELAPVVGTRDACAALAVPRASHYRRSRGRLQGPPRPRPAPPRTLSGPERTAVLDALHAPRFVDAAPAAVYATLLDEGTYLASERTMYRILAANAEVRERRDQLRHPAYARPELLATGPRRRGRRRADDLRAARCGRRVEEDGTDATRSSSGRAQEPCPGDAAASLAFMSPHSPRTPRNVHGLEGP